MIKFNIFKAIWLSMSLSATGIITAAVICFSFGVPYITLEEHNIYIAVTESILGLFTLGYTLKMIKEFIIIESSNSPTGIHSGNT